MTNDEALPTTQKKAVAQQLNSLQQPQFPSAKVPRRWLGRHGAWWMLLIGGGILAIYLIYDAIVAPHTISYRSLPVMSIALGSILAAACVFYAMLYRVRPEDGVTIARLFAALGIAAFVTTFLAGQAEGGIARWLSAILWTTNGVTPTVQLTLFAGPVEETLKALTVLLIGIGVRPKTLRGGLFLGGAIGLGFAAAENLGYFINGWEHPSLRFGQLGGLTFLIISRTVITPLLHPIFTALIGGMLFGASRDGRYRLSVPLVGTFLAIVAVHSLWDSVGVEANSLGTGLARSDAGGLALLAFTVMVGIAIAMPFIWRSVARRANVLAGLRPAKSGRPRVASYPPGPPPPAGWRPPATDLNADSDTGQPPATP